MKRIVPAFISLLGTVVVIELALRLLNYPYIGCKSLQSADEYRTGQFDPVVGWRYIPSRATAFGGKTYTFNAEGYRTDSIEDSTDFSKPRILIVGSSFLFGHELDFKETFGYKLATRLGNRYEVINDAVQGYGLDQTYLQLVTLMPRYSPTAVIVDIHEDQDYRNVNRDRRALFPCMQFAGTKPTFAVSNGKLTQTHSPERFETYDTPRLRLLWRRAEEKLRQQKTDVVLAQTIYREMKRYVEDQGAKLLTINYLLPIRDYEEDALFVDYGNEFTLDGVHPNDKATTRMVEEFMEKLGDELN